MGMVVPFPGTYAPLVMPIYTVFNDLILPFGEAGTAEQLNQKLAQGLPLLITGEVR